MGVVPIVNENDTISVSVSPFVRYAHPSLSIKRRLGD